MLLARFVQAKRLPLHVKSDHLWLFFLPIALMIIWVVSGWVSMPLINMMNTSPPDIDLPLVIAHRGASAVAPENTRSAIVEAIRMQAPVIEFDVRATSDGELVLFHDKDLERLVGRQGTVEASTLSEFEQMDVGRWFGDGSFAGEKPIRMAFAIELCLEGGAVPLIEHKSGSATAYAAVLRELDVVDTVIVQSFNWDFLTEIQNELPDLVIGALGSKNLEADRMKNLEALEPDWVGWNFKDFRESYVAKLHGLGSKIALWTVNDPAVAKRWVAVGVDAIITDRPDEMAGAFDPESE